MVQRIKDIAVKSDDVNSIPKSYIADEEQLPKDHMSTRPHTQVYVHIHNK